MYESVIAGNEIDVVETEPPRLRMIAIAVRPPSPRGGGRVT